MSVKLKVITPPAVEPISLSEVKDQIGGNDVDYDMDTVLSARIRGAREWVELHTSSALITTQYETAANAFPLSEFWRWPVQAIDSVTYIDSDGITQTVDPSVYTFDDYSRWSEPLTLRAGQTWPGTSGELNNARVRFTAGYGDSPLDIPEPIRQAIVMIVDHWTRYNADNEIGAVVSQIPMAVTHLLKQYRYIGE